MKNLLNPLVFLLGLVAVCWVGIGYLGSNPLGAAIALLIGACYLAGALELHRYRQATATLTRAVADIAPARSDLGTWLCGLDPGLRNAVRLRIEGERIALPAPAMTPYLVGLLVLLGMLGTLLGMMATLRGTGFALESASDLQAIRGALAAPVKGLAFAFGTSIAGVASSAMLGLLSALCRRERLEAVQLLDVHIATTLHAHSPAHRRAEALALLQQHAALMPTLVERLQAMMATLERQGASANERLDARQADFHAHAEARQARLSDSMQASLQAGVADGARAVAATLQPVVEATLAGVARQASALHDSVQQAVQGQLDGLSAGFDGLARRSADRWDTALAAQQRANEALTRDLRGTLEEFAVRHDQRSTTLADTLAARLDASADHGARAWDVALSRQQAAHEQLAARNRQALDAAAATFAAQAGSLAGTLQQSHADLQAALEARDQQRLALWSGTFASLTQALGAQWEQTGDHAARRQQEICDTLARTAEAITTQAQAHASTTIAEISRLVQVASEAPRAAADVVAELRQKLSDSLARDTAMLDERNRLLATLETLLDAVNHASTEQRSAVDALVGTSAELLDRVGSRFTDHIQAQTGRLETVAAQLTGSAVEVASLGDAFGAAVQQFGHSNEALIERLQHIAGALDASQARSDEQLAYYVAQAREVVDLSVLSQKQIIEELHQLAGHQAIAGSAAA
jgi:hypothetical protein